MNYLILINIWWYSMAHNVDHRLIESIVETESSYRPHITGKVGEIGLMQLKPYYLPGPLSLYHPETNIAIGVRELVKLKRLQPKLGRYWYVAWNMGATGSLNYAKTKDISKFSYAIKVGGLMEAKGVPYETVELWEPAKLAWFPLPFAKGYALRR